eukprot:TRINITY_DN27125_c0_g2_i1.p1 TRINITY_DN27125_c0_g2~~TRINITY_DN27125_c0_g2_i1.p1  ORF type:complete len:1165 (+),score=238.51 TRINITY_DN27125_c0_g2_i1:83-3496(+)
MRTAAWEEDPSPAPPSPDDAPVMDVHASREWEPVVDQLKRLNKNVEALSTAWKRSQQGTSMPQSAMGGMMSAYLENAIDYADKRPKVEVTIVVQDVTSVDLATGLFEASFKVILDWQEREFLEGIHYCQDVRSDQFVLSNWLKEDKNAFNPMIVINNMVDLLKGTEEDAENPIEPIIHRLVSNNASVDSVWLTKEYEFTGTLKASTDGRLYPFDIHRLPIEIKSVPMPGLTTLGGERTIELVDPRLRRMEAFEKSTKKKKHAVFRAERFTQVPDIFFAHHWEMRIEASEISQKSEDEDEELPLKLNVGELEVLAFGGCDNKSDEYLLVMVLARNWKARLFDFCIQILLTLVSLFSIYVPFNADTVANRLSISLAIILTIVFFATEKPAVIADLSYSTSHDSFEQNMILASTLISIENVFGWVWCYGTNREGLPDYYMHTVMFLGADICTETFLRASRLDTIFFFFILIYMLGQFELMILKAQTKRLRFLAKTLEELNSYYSEEAGGDHDNPVQRNSTALSFMSEYGHKQVNRLLLVLGSGKKAHFESSCSQIDVAKCLGSHGHSLVSWFPRFWLEMAKLNSDDDEDHHRPCSCCRKRRKAGTATEDGGDSANALNSSAPSAEWLERFVGTRPVLSKDEIGYIVDVGTGEIGFYQYRWGHPAGSEFDKHAHGKPPMLFVESCAKLAMDTNSTFKDSYCLTNDGSQKFAEELLKHYNLLDTSPSFGTSAIGGKDARPNTSHGSRRKKVKILIGPTGANRAAAMKSAEVGAVLEKFVERVEATLRGHLPAADVLLFIPSDSDEATFELAATEWLVQRGDLNVKGITSGVNGVPFAGMELSQALSRAASKAGSTGSCSLSHFMREFEDLIEGTIDTKFMEDIFKVAVLASSLGDDLAEISPLSDAMRSSPTLMRSLIKARLFNGTLSAGGGSCQVTVKPDHSQRASGKGKSSDELHAAVMRNSEFHSIPMGNKTPLTGNGLAEGKPLFPKSEPMTQELLTEWRKRLREQIASMDFPPKLQGNLRGVYIGISAVYYAADLAGCSQTLLPKKAFIQKLEEKLQELLENPPDPKEGKDGTKTYDHRAFSNLTLVSEVVNSFMADTAWIVCKRNWKAAPVQDLPAQDLPKYVATWTLGFFLNQAV